jgi:hypothetical protein
MMTKLQGLGLMGGGPNGAPGGMPDMSQVSSTLLDLIITQSNHDLI